MWDGLRHAPDGQSLTVTTDDADDDDIWYDCVLGYVGSVHTDITSACDPCDNRDRFTNMAGKVLSERLVQILNKGPNFALTRSVSRHILKNVEIGLERGAFALRWKKHIEKKSLSGQHSPSSEDASDLATTSNAIQSAPGETIDSDLLPGSTKRKVSLAPRFSDTDTRAAPTAGARTERTLKVLKHKVMTLYKQHKTACQRNHQHSDIDLLNELNRDPEVSRSSDKCKGMVLLSKDEYIHKAEAITNGYEPIIKTLLLN